MNLKWKCDGGCGKVLEENVDEFYLLKITQKDVLEEDQLIRLCMPCASTQLKRAEPDEN